MQSDILAIRELMERSAKFISLSGLSGILAGCYALIGAGIAHLILQRTAQRVDLIVQLGAIAVIVLLAAVLTAVLFSTRRAQKAGRSVWNPASRALLRAMAIPLVTGAAMVVIAIWQGYDALVIPVLLIFYGLSLIGGGQFTFNAIRGLGIVMTILGLLAFAAPGYDLIFWSVGFGAFHILYGSLIYFKHERKGRD